MPAFLYYLHRAAEVLRVPNEPARNSPFQQRGASMLHQRVEGQKRNLKRS
jgi:hypothetical protein